MNDAVLVRRLERRGNLLCNGNRVIDRNRSLRDPIRERRTVNQLEDERAYEPAKAGPDAFALFETVNRRDVRVVERRQNLSLALEALEPVGIEREELGKNLDRDVSIEPRIAPSIDLL